MKKTKSLKKIVLKITMSMTLPCFQEPTMDTSGPSIPLTLPTPFPSPLHEAIHSNSSGPFPFPPHLPYP